MQLDDRLIYKYNKLIFEEKINYKQFNVTNFTYVISSKSQSNLIIGTEGISY